ncbi:MAG: SMI1/KNR4 family protein [Paludibacteraceae bacterium]|nr:SMI1/KNR4 family protein [Paludibacteraceae bacterium]
MANLKATFSQFIELIKQSIPDMENRMAAGATEEEINAVQEHVGKKLPKDFVELYRLHNGERADNRVFFMAGLQFVSLQEVQSLYDLLQEFEESFEPMGTEAISTKSSDKNKWIPFATDDEDCYLAVDLTPERGNGKAGQVIAVDHGLGGSCTYLMAESFSEFIEKMMDWWKNGDVVAKDIDGKKYIEEKDGHFFNSIAGYAIMDQPVQQVPSKMIELKDEYWQWYFEKDQISTENLAKTSGEFRATDKDVSCEPIAYIGNPKEVYFDNCIVRDFHYLGQNPKVRSFTMDSPQSVDGDYSILKGCVDLQELGLRHVKDLTGIESVCELPNLKKLTIAGELTEQIRSLIVSLPHLTILELCSLEAKDVNLSFLSQLQNLKELEIRFKDATRLENLDFLLGLKNLTAFRTKTYAKDEGALKSVLQLKKLKEFRYPVSDLEVYRGNTKLTYMGVYGKENLDVSPLAETKCKEVYLFETDSFADSKADSILWKNLGKISNIKSIKYVQLLE